MPARGGMQVASKPNSLEKRAESLGQRKRKPAKRKKNKPSGPVRVKVTTLQPWDRVFVGRRWYTVRRVVMIGKKSNRNSVCVVHTLEKGGFHFRSVSRVQKSNEEVEYG